MHTLSLDFIALGKSEVGSKEIVLVKFRHGGGKERL
jgi:hypothetical protein